MAKKKSPIDFGDNRIWLGDHESRRKANTALEKMGIPSDYKVQYVAEKDMQGQAKKYLNKKSKSAPIAKHPSHIPSMTEPYNVRKQTKKSVPRKK